VRTRDWLGFAGVDAARVLMIQSEQQFAEKVHAYTLPRERAPNSRVRDLVDLALLVQSGIMDNLRVAAALHHTFERRGTHELPEHLTAPPEDWAVPFARMAEECALKMDATAAFHEVTRYFEVLLALDPGVV